MKRVLFLLVFSALLQASGQHNFQKVDREAIRLSVTDSSSAGYYPRLLSRFNDFDTTLTLNDYRLLYYGFVFQPGYSAYGDIRTKEIQESIGAKKYMEASLTIDSVLAKVPISLRANYQKAVALYLMDSLSMPYPEYILRYNKLVGAILSSGDGLTCETAFKTIFVADEYEIIYRHFAIEKVGGQALVYPCDRMTVTPNNRFTKTSLYFDTSDSFNQMKTLFPESTKPKKEKRKKDKRKG